MNFTGVRLSVEEILPDLTLGELLFLFLLIDVELNSRLNLLPISDTLDLRSFHVRKEVCPLEV